MSLHRYPAYKDSGVEWLDDIPAHWNFDAIKRVVALVESGVSVNAVDEPANSNEVGVLKTSCVYSGIFDPDENKSVVEEEISRVACPIRAGTLIVSRMNTPALVGAAGLVKEDASNLFLPDRLWQVHLAGVLPEFAHYWTATPSYRAQVQMACAGTSASMQNLSQDEFLQFVLPLPSSDEQQAIATFLDRETAKIDALIAEQEKLLALLAEKRQATISHAVTKGLNPDAPMKDSGIPWLGEVPVHWEVKPLMWLTDAARPIMYGIVLPGPDVGEGIPILKGGNVKPSRMRLDEMARTTPDIEAPYARARLKAGDLVYSIRGSIGDCEAVPDELEGSNITQDVARVAINSENFARWARWCLLSTAVREDLACESLGAAVRGVNIFDLKRARLPVPPLSEQAEIASFVDQEVEKLDQLGASAERGIKLLQERRGALIAAAVTGQIDVRGVVEPELS